MGSLKLYATVAGFLAVASSVSAARAADLLSPPPPPPPMAEPVAEVGGNWYLRGDVGVSNYQVGRWSNVGLPHATFYGEDMGSGAFAGAGIGYQFNSWFRADITGEYRFSTGLQGRDRESFVDGVGIRYNGFENYRGNHSASVFLLNGYFDLGNWYGITPFIGGGVGIASHHLSGFDTTTHLVGGPAGYQVLGGTIRNKTHDSFAWAIHAGLGYDVTPNLKLELAYRYLNMGEARTGLVDCYATCTQPGFKIKDIESHDIKLGMRWALGGPAPAYEAPPLIRKY